MIATDPASHCKVCDRAFIRFRSTQAVCSGTCARKAVEIDKRAERQELKRRKDAIKSRAEWMTEAQDAFNAWIRARDAELPCVSCGRHHNGQYHAGHYLTVGARPELRFDELNVHKQCSPCNLHLHGNLILYRVELIRRIGAEAVERLEGPHPPKKYSIDQLREIRDTYRRKLRCEDCVKAGGGDWPGFNANCVECQKRALATK